MIVAMLQQIDTSRVTAGALFVAPCVFSSGAPPLKKPAQFPEQVLAFNL